MIDQGFIRMLVTVMVFFHIMRGLYIVVHGDDFMAVGTLEDLQWLNEILEMKFEVKRSPYVGPSSVGDEATSGKFLKGTVSWTEEGFHWESDVKHARTVSDAYSKVPAAREISPASKNIGKEVPTALDKLGYAVFATFALFCLASRDFFTHINTWIHV